jgi:hypothetical protein
LRLDIAGELPRRQRVPSRSETQSSGTGLPS